MIAFLTYGAQTPPLDELNRALEELELERRPTADASLVRSLNRELSEHADLARDLAGETGARILEASRDGWAAGSEFHIVVGTGSRAPASLSFEMPASVELTVSRGAERLVQRGPGQLRLPESWLSPPLLIHCQRSSANGLVRVRGVAKGAAR
jgi:hypothetical protein